VVLPPGWPGPRNCATETRICPASGLAEVPPPAPNPVFLPSNRATSKTSVSFLHTKKQSLYSKCVPIRPTMGSSAIRSFYPLSPSNDGAPKTLLTFCLNFFRYHLSQRVWSLSSRESANPPGTCHTTPTSDSPMQARWPAHVLRSQRYVPCLFQRESSRLNCPCACSID
jgi:hypothetical protein